MPTKSEQELKETKQRLVELVLPLLQDQDPKTWKLKGGKDKKTTGLAYRAKHEVLGKIFKFECELDISVNQFLDFFVNKLKPTDWVPNIGDFKILESADDNNWEIVYTLSIGVPTIDDRDFVTIRFRDFYENGGFCDLTIATTHPDAPEKPKVIRGECLPSGCIIRPHPDDPKRSEVIWITNLKMKGNLSKKIVRLAMTKFLLDFSKAMINKANEMAAKYPAA